jgi:DNA primase
MVTGVYNYYDANGCLIYFKHRLEPGRNGQKKEFRFFHMENNNRQSGRGSDPVAYHLPEVLRSKAVIITEGEKQADLLKSWGLCATSLDSGAGSRLIPSIIGCLTAKRIAILRDNDEPGLAYALKLANGLKGKFESLRIVLLPDLPEKGDICDWNGNKAHLLEIIKATPEWIPPPPEPKKERRKATKEFKGSITTEMIEVASQYPIEKLIEFQNGKAICFNHKEKTPSMTQFKNKCHCHGACGRSWSTIDVCIERDNMTFINAVKYLAGCE